MGDVVNLRGARKRKARADRERQAAENRVRYGQTGAERRQRTAEEARAARKIEGHRLTERGEADEP